MIEEEEEEGDRPELGRKMISLRSAMIAYAILLVFAAATLKGYALGVAIITVLGMAAKSYVHYLREHME